MQACGQERRPRLDSNQIYNILINVQIVRVGITFVVRNSTGFIERETLCSFDRRSVSMITDWKHTKRVRNLTYDMTPYVLLITCKMDSKGFFVYNNYKKIMFMEVWRAQWSAHSRPQINVVCLNTYQIWIVQNDVQPDYGSS